MTTTESPTEPSGIAAVGRFPAVPAPRPARAPTAPAPWRTGRRSGASGRERLAGVDAARGLAVLGMIVAHVAAAEATSTLWTLVNGRAAVLFGVLGGVSLALMARSALRSGDPRDRAALRRRVAVRAGLLIVLGVVLAAVSTGPMVILAVYGVEFLLVLPLLFAGARTLTATASVWAVAGPLLSFALRSVLPGPTTADGGTILGGVLQASDLTSGAGLVRAVDVLLLSGAYPVLTWMPFLLLGMAIGRLDLRAAAGRLLAGGLVGATIGYGGSWLAVDVLGGRQALLGSVAPVADRLGMPPEAALEILGSSSYGTVATTTPAWLLVAAPHSGSPFDVVGAAGVAVAVLGLCLLVARAVPALLVPLAATGSLALTVYAGHIVVLTLAGGAPETSPWAVTAVFCAIAVLFAAGWRGLAGRGPLEQVVHVLSARAGGAR
ncbi:MULTISPECIES: DUF418 domain-containing protein [unclassified Pseudonocardia]|uniref:DUF418 domain-containing protein n=1 Tax=unclassified Pseudonocardia TaxID=2619320 RepID=UPI0011AEA929|nr:MULTISPECIES: heparan-alpha-glucosaminide N-acetyltransferase domain-containing protein [unclassified Pseudonocardia]